MVKVVTYWNICVAQSDMITYNFPAGKYKHKAHLITDFQRVIEQLHEMAFAPVETVESVERMVQDIKAGDNVVCPVVVKDVQTVIKADDYSCYFKITFNGSLGTQTFERGETLFVCNSNDTQINEVSNTEEAVQMNAIYLAVLDPVFAGNFPNVQPYFVSLLAEVEEPEVLGDVLHNEDLIIEAWAASKALVDYIEDQVDYTECNSATNNLQMLKLVLGLQFWICDSEEVEELEQISIKMLKICNVLQEENMLPVHVPASSPVNQR